LPSTVASMAGVIGSRRESGECERVSTQSSEKSEAKKDHEAIIQGLAQGRVVWSGNFCIDCWFHLKQTHIFLGIFACHKMHPYSRCERLFVWLSCAAAAFGLSIFFLRSDGTIEKRSSLLDAGFVVSCWLTVIHFVLYQATMAKCCHEGGGCHFGGVGRVAGECAGKFILASWVIFAAFCLLGAFMTSKKRRIPVDRALGAWVVSQIYSAVQGIFVSVAMFLYYRYGLGCCNPCSSFTGSGQSLDRPNHPSFCYPHGIEYPKDVKLMWDGDRCRCHEPPGRGSVDAIVLDDAQGTIPTGIV